VDAPPVPRCWFISDDGTELIQVQQDRFIHNWRRARPTDEYPRYEQVRQRFVRDFETFEGFLHREGLGTLELNQCEVTYLNHIEPSGTGNSLGDLDKVITIITRQYSDDYLGSPETIAFDAHYLMEEAGRPRGRLHITSRPQARLVDGSMVLALSLTARGAPLGPGFEDALRFLDLGRNWIVRGFTSITTKPMHQLWGRYDRTD
jgi:uncharacterized protein (TIGR04255 family)